MPERLPGTHVSHRGYNESRVDRLDQALTAAGFEDDQDAFVAGEEDGGDGRREDLESEVVLSSDPTEGDLALAGVVDDVREEELGAMGQLFERGIE